MSTLKVDDIQSRQSTDDAISLASDSSVSLKHSASAKLTTTSSGVSVTGTCTATTFSGSGASLTSLPAANITGTLPAIDGSALTGVGGGSLEFVKKISLTGNQTSIVEYGLDYDTVYRFNLNHVRTTNYTLLRVYPHVDNSATKHNNGDCSAHYMNYSGTSNSAYSNDGWYFSPSGWLTKSSGYFEIYTG